MTHNTMIKTGTSMYHNNMVLMFDVRGMILNIDNESMKLYAWK